MEFFELFLIAVGLSMDAFAVAVCKGLSAKKLCIKHYITVGLWFGIFQALMPAIGYFIGSTFAEYVTEFDHWIAFVLLAIIGANMLKEGLSKEDEESEDCSECESSFAPRSMLLLAIATSIDALAVGVSFAVREIPSILSPVLLIGVCTFLLSMLGVKIGNIFGIKYKSRAEIAGGIILILMGLKILLEDLGIINF